MVTASGTHHFPMLFYFKTNTSSIASCTSIWQGNFNDRLSHVLQKRVFHTKRQKEGPAIYLHVPGSAGKLGPYGGSSFKKLQHLVFHAYSTF